jgi:predicted nucleotidyltransferase
MNTQRQLALSNALDAILDVLISQYQPGKVILFGSLANDSVGDWSDIDLLIVKDTPLPFYQRLREVALLCPAWVGVDFLVYTPNELNQMIAEHNPFVVEEIIGKGRVIYERQPAPSMA